MAYKVFFAFQMDIADRFCKGFIQSAIRIAVLKFKEEGIDIELTYGFRGTPGTSLLINEMLKKSDESDMVIADLTFTSAREWLDGKVIEEDENYKWIEVPKVDRKPSPNPNVLLETGYAWAKKGTYRTLVIMNEAYGSPENLPVDLKGFRWGIKYNLNEANYADRRAKRCALAGELYEAIKNSIASEASYQRDKWKPLRLQNDWFPSDFRRWGFRATPKIKQKLYDLRAALDNPDLPQRIVGPKNSGKTRLAFEIYRDIDGDLPKHENFEKVLYYDLDGGNIQYIQNQLIELKAHNQRKIVILDNCSYQIHQKVHREYFYDTSVSLLTISQSEDGLGATQVIDFDFANEIIEKLSNEEGHPGNTTFIAQSAKGNIRNALAIIENIPEGAHGLSTNYYEKWKQLLGPELGNPEVLQVLEQLSLFSHIGYNGDVRRQSEFIFSQSGVSSRESFDAIINRLTEKGIVKVTGDNIILEAFVDEFGARRLEKLATENLESFFTGVTEVGLSKQFSRRFVELGKLHGTKQLIDILSKENGLLTKYEFIATSEGGRIVMRLAELEPEKILTSLETILSPRSKEDLSTLGLGGRFLVSALERLAFRKATFKGAAKLLYKIAESEKRGFDNAATRHFIQLFQYLLPGTEASLNERIQLLEEILHSDNPNLGIINEALGRALIIHGLNRMGGADNQAGEELQDYKPESNEDKLNYWAGIIGFLVEVNGYEVLVNRFRDQIMFGNSEAMIGAIETLLSKGRKIDNNLRQQLEYFTSDSGSVNPEVLQRILKILEQYTENSIRDRLEFSVAKAPYSVGRDGNGIAINRSEIRAIELAEELVKSGKREWLSEIDVLLQGEQRFSFSFGKEIGRLNPDNQELIDVIVANLKKIPKESQNPYFLFGYISALPNKAFVRSVIDAFLLNAETSQYAINLTKFVDPEIADLEKLFPLLSQKPDLVTEFEYFLLAQVSSEDFIRFLSFLKEVGAQGWLVAIDVYGFNLEHGLTVDKSLLELGRSLIMKDGILSQEEFPNSLQLHYYVLIVKKLHESGLDSEVVKFLSNEIVNACSDPTVKYEYEINELLVILLSDYWEECWPIIYGELAKGDFVSSYNLEGLLKKYQAYKSDKLISWLESKPDEAPQRIFGIIPLTLWKDGNEEWSPIALEMFDKYFGNKEFIDSISRRLENYSISGSPIPFYKSRLELLEKLRGHEKLEVKQVAEKSIQFFSDRLKRQERFEENNSLEL